MLTNWPKYHDIEAELDKAEQDRKRKAARKDRRELKRIAREIKQEQRANRYPRFVF